MKKNFFLSFCMMVFTVFFINGCINTIPAKEKTTAKIETAIATTTIVITNTRFSIAPNEYPALSEKVVNHIGKIEFYAWADMMEDNVVYTFPDDGVDARTKDDGKAAVVILCKKLKEISAVQFMTMIEFNHFPINLTAQPKASALVFNYNFAYFQTC